jgi:hypothetical protein
MLVREAFPLRFQVVRRLGAGGFGEVFEATDTARGGRVALKRLHRADAPSLLRFKTEFRALAATSHPNVVQLYELFVDEAGAFFTMEYVDGVDVRARRAAVAARIAIGGVPFFSSIAHPCRPLHESPANLHATSDPHDQERQAAAGTG